MKEISFYFNITFKTILQKKIFLCLIRKKNKKFTPEASFKIFPDTSKFSGTFFSTGNGTSSIIAKARSLKMKIFFSKN